MVKHWSQQMSATINGEASRNITRKASQMVDKANSTQRQASAAIDSGDDFSHQSTQVIDNYDNFDQTIMEIEFFHTDKHLNRTPQPEMESGAQTEVTFPQNFTPLSLN